MPVTARRDLGWGAGEKMGNIHSAASLVVRLCLRRARKRPVRSGGRTASRIAAFLAVAVVIGGATAARADAATGPSIIVNGDTTDNAVQGPNDSLKFFWALDGSSTWDSEMVAGSGTTYSVPSMIVNGNTIDITAMGFENDLQFYSATNGGTWNIGSPARTLPSPCRRWSSTVTA